MFYAFSSSLPPLFGFNEFFGIFRIWINYFVFRIESPVGCLFHSQEVSVSSLLSENIPIEIAPTRQTTTLTPAAPTKPTKNTPTEPTPPVDDNAPVARDGIEPESKPEVPATTDDREEELPESSNPVESDTPTNDDDDATPKPDYEGGEEGPGVEREDEEVKVNVLTTESTGTTPDNSASPTNPPPKTKGTLKTKCSPRSRPQVPEESPLLFKRQTLI